MLTEQKADLLNDFLTKDAERGKALLELSPEKALEIINAEGLNCTLEDLNDYCAALKIYVAQKNEGEELTDEALENVAGGLIITTAICVKVGLGLLACYGVGAGIGIAAGAKW